jgi:hypothetical protein
MRLCDVWLLIESVLFEDGTAPMEPTIRPVGLSGRCFRLDPSHAAPARTDRPARLEPTPASGRP